VNNSIPWTPEQLAFFDALDSTNDSIALIAVAGSGKTTTLVEGVRHLRGSTLAVAFNVRIKQTLEEQVGEIAVCRTLNGLGHRALMQFFNRKIKIDSNKMGKIVQNLLKMKENERFWKSFSSIRSLASCAKHHGLVPANTPGSPQGLIPDVPESWQELADHYDIDIEEPGVARLACHALRLSNTASWGGTCDFDDQIYIPVCWGAPFDKFKNVLVDEAQDLSHIQHVMLRRTLSKTGRLIAVGDPSQAIYGFRAAADDSMERLIETFHMRTLGLSVSFRCAKAIVYKAQEIVPRIQPSPSAPDGFVTHLSAYDETAFGNDSCCVVCRNNGPTITLAYRLIASGKGVAVLGRNIGAGLKALINKLTRKDLTIPLPTFCTNMENWAAHEVDVATAKEQWSKIANITDKTESLAAIINGSGVETLPELIKEIDSLFAKKVAKIILSTVHKAKGMEWDHVFFLDYHLIPSRWAVEAAATSEDAEWMLCEEDHLKYVGTTRARLTLTYITTGGWKR